MWAAITVFVMPVTLAQVFTQFEVRAPSPYPYYPFFSPVHIHLQRHGWHGFLIQAFNRIKMNPGGDTGDFYFIFCLNIETERPHEGATQNPVFHVSPSQLTFKSGLDGCYVELCHLQHGGEGAGFGGVSRAG
jgi:hypothetical protein